MPCWGGQVLIPGNHRCVTLALHRVVVASVAGINYPDQAEAEQVFFNLPLLLLNDTSHSQEEPRRHALGNAGARQLAKGGRIKHRVVLRFPPCLSPTTTPTRTCSHTPRQ